MGSESGLGSLLRGITEDRDRALNELELLRSVAERVRRVVPYHAGAWLMTDPATSLFTDGHVERFDQEVCEPWFHNELHEDDVHKFHDLVGGPPAVLSRNPQASDSPRYNELMRPSGLDDEVRLTLDDSTGCWGTVELHRKVGDPEFTHREAQLLGRMAPVVASGIRQLTVERDAGTSTDPDGPGLVHVHLDGTAEPVTEAGAAWLELLLPPHRREVRTAFKTLASLVLGTDTPAAGSRRLRRRTADGRWVTLHASRMLSSETVAVIIEPSRPGEIADLIARAHELTPRERDVVLALARGASTADMADQLFITRHTVRDHIKSALSKVGVGSRTELVARLFQRHYASTFFQRVNVEN